MVFDLKDDFYILTALNLLNYQDVFGVKKAWGHVTESYRNRGL